jgi:hypothetical protein
MARYNEILVGRYNRFLQKLLSMKGGPPAPQLSSEINAGFVLTNGKENRWLEDFNDFGVNFFLVAGGAGNRGVMRLRNPAGSNVIAVLQRITLSNNDASTIQPNLSFTNTNLDRSTLNTTSGLGEGRSTRASTCIASSQNNAVVAITGTVFYICTLGPNANQDVIVTDGHELVLTPGIELNIFIQSTNQAGSCSLLWRERAMEESELK